MGKKPVHICQCEICQTAEPHPDKAHHARVNLFLSRLDEQQRRWYIGLEAERMGHGGTELMAKIRGINIDTIRKGRWELADNLANRWAGQPLHSLQTMLNYIRNTTTSTGLTVRAFLLDQVFKKGRKLSVEERQSINLQRRPICPTWNYMILPNSPSEIMNHQLIS